jgi:predicted ATPase/DNA-binding XRE family transcriptional regulator
MQEEISFGIWLRKQRQALDLSRQAFANQVGCAEVTLRRIEGGTLKPSKELANLLLEKLGIPETERPQWIDFARGLSGFPLQSSSSSTKPLTNLPAPLTSFIGREKEQSEVIRLITKHRLVTLTGLGGVGKTRLSLKVGGEVLENYADGVWFVELAAILDPLLLPRTTAMAIGLRDEPQRPVIDMLSDYLRDRKMLIILDNCEHLLDACAHLADMLLKRCHNLKIFATSREALGILGEAVYLVPSLEMPNFQQLVENFRDYEAVRLFEERAQLVRTDFLLTIENATSIAKICSRLDGIPLAIELAAARVNMFSPEQIATQLQESFVLLMTGNRTALPRHQTLQAAIDWSYDLLSADEQTLFRRLSAFVNGWTLEAAKFVCSDSNMKFENVLDLLHQLISKSLVNMEEIQGKVRYSMLETIRLYANEKLMKRDESDLVHDKHLEYFLNLAETAEPHLIRSEQIEWLPVLDSDYENLCLALEWSLSKDTVEPSLNLSRALGWFWIFRCYWLEGLNWLTRALAKPPQAVSKSEQVARARALVMENLLEGHVGKNVEQILSTAEASLALALEVSEKRDIAIAMYLVGNALILNHTEDNRARSLLERSFAELQALNEPFWELSVYHELGVVLARDGKVKFRDLHLKSLELARKAGERLALAEALLSYANWLLRDNRLDEAREHAEEANRLYKQIDPTHSRKNFYVLARIAWVDGDYQKAKSFYKEMLDHVSLLGQRIWTYVCLANLGLLAMEEQDLSGGQAYLEHALVIAREVGLKYFIAEALANLGNLSYLQGNYEGFKQNFTESLSLKNYLTKWHKAAILAIIVGSLYFQKPENSTQLLRVIDDFEKEDEFPLTAIDKRYWIRAEAHTRKVLGDAAFEVAFAEGQEMSLDEGLDLTLKMVEEM